MHSGRLGLGWVRVRLARSVSAFLVAARSGEQLGCLNLKATFDPFLGTRPTVQGPSRWAQKYHIHAAPNSSIRVVRQRVIASVINSFHFPLEFSTIIPIQKFIPWITDQASKCHTCSY